MVIQKTFIVQYNKAHHIVVDCSVIVTKLNIGIKMILIMIQIERLHGTKFLYPDEIAIQRILLGVNVIFDGLALYDVMCVCFVDGP